MSMIHVNDLRSGEIFKENGQPFVVLKYAHVKMGRGNAVIKIKARNLKSGSVLEKTFLSGASVEEADVEKSKVQFLYKNGKVFFFMDIKSFDQMELSEDFLGENVYFLKEGENYEVLRFNGSPVSLELPITIVLKVAQTGSSFKGDSVSNTYKKAVMETGLKVDVPLFIADGEAVKVDTRDRSYVGRAL